MFVLEIDPDSRSVVIGPREGLKARTIRAAELNWLSEPLAPGDVVQAQIRHRSPAEVATIVALSNDTIELVTENPISAVSPGQSLVLYAGSKVIGGAVIDRVPRVLPVAAA